MSEIELLSPAGNMRCLTAAVQNGADAVYFGGGAFNARRGAENFDGDALKSAVDYCRLRGVKTHITLNTMLFDRELADAVRFAAHVYELGCDAVIVQDIGLASILRAELPQLAIHASTQMGIHSLGGLKYAEQNGIGRVVLAREVSLSEICRMHEQSPVELEFFCHGALCMSFSGSCLYSSMAGERSGNRGTCAQPCRKAASVLSVRRAESDELCLSPNDICMIDAIDALRGAGVASLKIEGRMKSPEYVAMVTRCYREALDGTEKAALLRRKLFSIFNRGEFSTSHLYKDSVKTGGIGCAKPSKELLTQARESMNGENRLHMLTAVLEVKQGKSARLTFETDGISVSADGEVVLPAEHPIDAERYRQQVKKLGGTPFYADDCTVLGDGYVSVGAINALRREAVMRLNCELLKNDRKHIDITDDDVKPYLSGDAAVLCDKPLVYARVRTAEDARTAFACGADIAAIEPIEPCAFDVGSLAGLDRKRVYLAFPNVLPSVFAQETYGRLVESGAFGGAEINNIGQLDMVRAVPNIVAGIGLNAANGAAVNKLLSLGVTRIIPSLELTSAQLRGLSEKFGQRLIISVYGRAPLMQLLHCPVREARGCQGCTGCAGAVVDGDGRRFPLSNIRFGFVDGGKRTEQCLVRMKNCEPTYVCDIASEAGKVYAYAVTVDECDAYGVDRVVLFASGGGKAPDSYTRGHWNRRVE